MVGLVVVVALCCGTRVVETLRGEDDREPDRGRLDDDEDFVGGDMGRAAAAMDDGDDDVWGIGEGAWICIDMARVGRAGNGTRPRLMESERGEAVGEDLGVSVARGIRSG